MRLLSWPAAALVGLAAGCSPAPLAGDRAGEHNVSGAGPGNVVFFT
jgi:hypothetical protein